MSTFKEKFDKYELIFTPFIMMLVLISTLIILPQLILIDNFGLIFEIPLIIGIITGIFVAYLLDKIWKKVSASNISDFLKMPTLVLLLIAAVGTLMASYNIVIYFSIIGFGLGNMFSFITISSLTVYYRTYYKKGSK